MRFALFVLLLCHYDELVDCFNGAAQEKKSSIQQTASSITVCHFVDLLRRDHELFKLAFKTDL